MRWLAAIFISGLATAQAATPEPVGPAAPGSPFLERYPALKSLVFNEPVSPVRIGFGVTPLAFMPGKIAVALSGLQAHYSPADSLLDWEVLNASVALALADPAHSSRHFVFRTAPKYKILSGLSAGPLLGYEYVTFPQVQAQLQKAGFVGNLQPFSSQGLIYGAVIAETFPWKDSSVVRISQTLYRQTYGLTTGSDAFTYRFADPGLEADPDKAAIKPGMVFQVEISVLF
jgi:hypothetical protein